MKIKTNSFSAFFDIDKNNFTVLQNLKNNDNYIKNSPKFPLISILVYMNREKHELYPENGTICEKDYGLCVEYPSFGGENIKAELKISANADKLIIAANIENKSKNDIVEVIMPRLNGISLGNTHTDDVILYPHHAGERSVNPVRRYKQMADGEWGRHWRAACLPIDDYYRREINYCGLASMTWMYLHDNDNGLYVGSHDARFPVTGIIAETSGDESNAWMGFAFRKHNRICPNESWNSGEYCIAISCEDWHYGAKLYREYIMPLLDIHSNANFLNDEVALHQCYNFKHSGNITRRFADIPDIYDKGAQWGVKHMFMASWNRTGFDSSYPEYYPDMDLGSAMSFRRGIEYIKDNGGFTTLYINARIFDVTSDFHATMGEQMAIRTLDGKAIEEVYGPAHFTVNCPSDKLWQDYLIDTADFAAMAYGCQGIYLDQLASAEPHACYNKNHSHAQTGDFNQGYLHIMRTLLQRLQKRNPNAYLMVENCGDIYASYCWGSLTWNGNTFDEFFNMFKYTFPEFVQVNMTDPRGWVSDPDELREWFYKDMQRAILLGSILWLGITDHLERHLPEYREYARKALEFRKMLQPYIKQAVYLDNIFVHSISDNCDASCWQLGDGRVMLIAGNHSLCEGAIAEFVLPRPALKVRCVNTALQEQKADINGCKVTIPLAEERLFCAVVSFE